MGVSTRRCVRVCVATALIALMPALSFGNHHPVTIIFSSTVISHFPSVLYWDLVLSFSLVWFFFFFLMLDCTQLQLGYLILFPLVPAHCVVTVSELSVAYADALVLVVVSSPDLHCIALFSLSSCVHTVFLTRIFLIC
jgi:hypothetical protein